MRVGASFCSLDDMYARSIEAPHLWDNDWWFIRYAITTAIRIKNASGMSDREKRAEFSRCIHSQDWKSLYQGHEGCELTGEVRGLAFRIFDLDLETLKESGGSIAIHKSDSVGIPAAIKRYENSPEVVCLDNGMDCNDWNTIVGSLRSPQALSWLDRALESNLWDSWELRTWRRPRRKRTTPVDEYMDVPVPSAYLYRSSEGWETIEFEVNDVEYGEGGVVLKGTVLGVHPTPPQPMNRIDWDAALNPHNPAYSGQTPMDVEV